MLLDEDAVQICSVIGEAFKVALELSKKNSNPFRVKDKDKMKREKAVSSLISSHGKIFNFRIISLDYSNPNNVIVMT